MTAYWVSTPGYTVLMVVDAGGVIRHCAPYCRSWAQGKPWDNVRTILRQRHGVRLRIERLE